MRLTPCKHLDYAPDKYGPDITLEQVPNMTCADGSPVKFWRRGRTWTDNGDGARNPECVQFCGKGRGRINAIFDCYDGSLPCYEPGQGGKE